MGLDQLLENLPRQLSEIMQRLERIERQVAQQNQRQQRQKLTLKEYAEAMHISIATARRRIDPKNPNCIDQRLVTRRPLRIDPAALQPITTADVAPMVAEMWAKARS